MGRRGVQCAAIQDSQGENRLNKIADVEGMEHRHFPVALTTRTIYESFYFINVAIQAGKCTWIELKILPNYWVFAVNFATILRC